MRQAGIIAKFGHIALETMVEQIKNDHDNALILAKGLSTFNSIDIDLDKIHSNIVYFKLHESAYKKITNLADIMKDEGILFFEVSPNRYRLVTHFGINSNHIQKVLNIFNQKL